MAMAATKLRATRFRLSDTNALLPPPLPLIDIPDEVRLARTGVPGLRPMHLPVRRHIIESHSSIGSGGSAVTKTMREPEPILRESRVLIESEAEEDEAREVVARVHVYEYNQPEVIQNSDAPEDTLVFDSLFESGNLQRAERVYRRGNTGAASKRHEYELLIHPDIKNSAYRQWFYFEVRNGKTGVTYKFALTNLAKSGALFGSGLQPVVYSDIDAKTKGIGWTHRGTHVRYDVSLAADSAPGTTCLSFQYEFEHEHDCVYFACLQPYTYTDLNEYLENLERDPERAAVCRRTELCQSIAQNPCDLLSVTSSGKDGIPPDEKRVIVISARVHPGEPNSSWMMKGIIDYLTGASSGAQVLRKHFVFKVVPMLNPDGVINGNTRVNLAGWDLNRKWSYPVEKLFPTVFHLKRQIANLQARDRVVIYCDLHGHSLNRNIFTYGCYNKKSKRSVPTAHLGSTTNLASSVGGNPSTPSATSTSGFSASVKNDPRVFPMIVARHSRFFSFASCDFKVHKSKLNTARVVVNHELGVINSYTLEASFCGPDFGPRKDTQFATWDLEEMGQSWCQSLLIYFDLVADVQALDAQMALMQQEQLAVSTSPGIAGPDSSALLLAASPTLEIASSLLSDCEAAISELFASGAGIEFDDDVADIVSMDSDLSGAEDEPIPPNHATEGERFLRATSESAEGYSSAPEDGEKTSHERGRRGGRRKSRGAGRKSAKKGSKCSKPAKAKKDQTRVPDAASVVDGAAAGGSTLADQQPALLNAAAAMPASTKKKAGVKLRHKSKSGKKERSKSFHGHKKAAVSDESNEDEPADAVLAVPLPSVRANSELLVLPIMPGSAGRRHLKSASQSATSGATQQQQLDGGAAPDSRVFLCPTPPAHRGRTRLLRTGSPPPIELPLVKPLSLLRSGDSGLGSFKERIIEARVPSGVRNVSDRSDSDQFNDKPDEDHEGDAADSDSDASAQSGPESYLSEF